MTFNEYQSESRKTSLDKNWRENLVLCSLGLAGEAGEVVEKIKKIIRDKNYYIDTHEREEIKKEMGDVLWYLSQLSTVLELDFSEVAQSNITKIRDRHKRGVIAGAGDNR